MERYELASIVGGGVYQPSTFLIKYKSSLPIVDVMNSPDEFVILHEYIHFLQDISTSFGCMNFCNYLNRLQYGANQIYKSDSSFISLPLSLKHSPLIEKAVKVFDSVWGNTSGLNGKNRNATVRYELFTITGESVPLYFIEKDSQKYIIGTKDILENMTYIIERTIYGDNSPPPYFPYRTIEYIASQIVPSLASRVDLLCALCELSLFSTSPATMLIDNLRRIARTESKFETMDDLVAFFEEGLSFHIEDGRTLTSVNQLTDYSVPLAKEFAFKSLPTQGYEPLRNWISTVFDEAAACRRADPVFISRSLTMENPRDYFLIDLISRIGCPTIMNFRQELMTFEHAHNTNQVIHFHAVREMMDILFKGKKECGLYVGCVEECRTNNGAYEISEACYTSPWKKAKETKLCPLGQLFYMWGLAEREFKFVAKA